MFKPEVSLIFPLYNNPKMTIEALESLKNTTAGVRYEVICVDDGSPEDMSEVQNRKDLYDVYITLPENTGNSTIAVNIGAKHSRGKYIQYQNNDVLFAQPQWLRLIVDAFESDYNIAVVGCKALYKNNTVNHSMRRWVSDDMSQQSSHYERGVALEDSSNGVIDCQLVAGCGLTTRASLLKEEMGFTVYKPFGWDDADWCFKMQAKGYRVVCQADAWFYHFGSVSYGGKETPEYYDNKKIIEDTYNNVIQND